VEDTKRNRLRKAAPPTAYLYIPHFPENLAALDLDTFEVRSAIPPLSLVPQVRHLLQRLDSRLAPIEVRTLAEQGDWSLYQEKMMSALSSFLVLLALILACVGLGGDSLYR